MARFLIGTMPFVSHINPALPIARELVDRGHEVWWYTGQSFRARIEAVGARYTPMRAATDFDDDTLDATFPRRKTLKGPAQFKWSIKHIFMDAAPGQLQDIQQILREFPADVLLAESTFGGAQFAYELGGPPWASFNILPMTIASRDAAPFGLGLPPSASNLGRLRNQSLHWLFNNVLFRDVVTHYRRVRRSVGLTSPAGVADISPFLYLQGGTPAFEYPRSDLPPQVHFVGPLLPEPPARFTPPSWWPDLQAGRPVILVTQGTVATQSEQLIVPTIEALADLDVLVVATTGGKPVESVKLDMLPSNVRIERFIPYHQLLPHVDVMVTNGGYGGVQLALAHGVPLVAAGETEEKPEICARIAWAGVGINLKTKSPGPAQVRMAVNTLLRDPSYRQRAQAIQADFAQHNAPCEAAELLEQLAASRQPVLRARPVAAALAVG
jgi:MGT family glycosyltransferase